MLKQNNNTIDFPTILASSVHDIKNSLSTVRELILQMAEKYQSEDNHDFIQLEFEANRMNNSLIQLLELYKIDSENFTLDIDEHSVSDIMQEVQAQQSPLLKLNKITLTTYCDEDLVCYCDYNHISNALGSILNNAQRYTDTEIHFSSYAENDYIVFCLEDNGKGYPEQLLSNIPGNNFQIECVSGSTGLGLHFANTIARLHSSKNSKGFIKIDNNSKFKGARFRLFLP